MVLSSTCNKASLSAEISSEDSNLDVSSNSILVFTCRNSLICGLILQCWGKVSGYKLVPEILLSHVKLL